MHHVLLLISWSFSLLAVTVPLAVMLLLALPSGLPLEIAAHAGLLVAGAAIVVAIHEPDDKP